MCMLMNVPWPKRFRRRSYTGDNLMGFHQRQVAGHADMHLYGDMTAYAARAEVMDVAETRILGDGVHDVLLHCGGKTFLQELSQSLRHQLPCRPEDKHADDDGGDRSRTAHDGPSMMAPPMPMAVPTDDNASLR